MSNITPSITNYFQRYLFVFATLFLVLFSSCAVKASVKTFVGIPTKTQQGLPKANHNLPVNSVGRCTVVAASDTQIIQKRVFDANDLLPVVLFTASFLFLFSFRTVSKENKHPVYSGSSKIRSSIPIFLEYRKLIIHFSH